MNRRITRHRIVLSLVVLVAVILLSLEAYQLSPPLRIGMVSLRERVGASDSLVGMLSDSDHHVGQAASDSLVRLGPAAVPALIRGVGHSVMEVRLFALATLGRIGPPARDALGVIGQRARDDPDKPVRQTAIRTLAAVGENDPDTITSLAAILDSSDDTGRILVAEMLGRMGSRAAAAVPALARALKDPAVGVRREAAEALGTLGPVAVSAIPALICALEDLNVEVRIEAAEALGNMAGAARPAVPGLIGALGDTHPKVRGEAAGSLEKITRNWGEGELPLRDRALDAIKHTVRNPAP